MARVTLLRAGDVAAEHRTFAEALDSNDGFINLYAAMAHSPVALRRFLEFMSCLWESTVPARLREIAILSVAAASGARYPLGWHILDAKDAGLTGLEIDAAIDGDASDALSAEEAAVAYFAWELALDAQVDEANFRAVAEFMDERQLVELTMIVGAYCLVARVANGLNIDLDDAPARALGQLGL